MIVRGTDLTRLMVTMGVALVLLELANKFDNITGGIDGLPGRGDRTHCSGISSSTSVHAWRRFIR
jgi:ABC-type branched-subunit amino acid transport system permease subunit